ncbi:uncharacterized protein TNCV_1980791 [Trichonephila clavipes]|nr:uncharacterized protein TNCV_1980791 [Trichonephila clavipes]
MHENVNKEEKNEKGDWKYKRIYNPQRCLRVLVERCRKDSLQALARLLIDGYSSRKRKGRPASFQAKKCVVPDDVRLASVGNHMPRWFPIIEGVGNVAERNKNRGPATCVQNVMFPCEL